MNPRHQTMLQEAFQAFQVGNLIEAEQVLRHFAKDVPDNYDALHLLAIVCASQSNHHEAIHFYKRVLKLNPNDSSVLSNLGVSLSAIGRVEEALAIFNKSLEMNPDSPESWYNAANTLCDLERFKEALPYYEKSVKLNPEYFEAYNNYGKAFFDLMLFSEALFQFDKALDINQDFPDCLLNKGEALRKLKRYDEAISHFDSALRLKPDYAECWSNKGVTLNELLRYDEAISHYDKALSLKPDYAECWSNKGATLNELRRYDEAISHFDKALSLKPDIDWVYGHFLHAKMKIGDWSGMKDNLEITFKRLANNEKIMSPFALLAFCEDVFLLKKSSEIYTQFNYPENSTLGSIPKLTKKEKIRIAYFSPDFRNHPVAYLTSELFEIHDRNKFEVFAFSLHQQQNQDETSLRLRNGFDRFIDTHNMTDLEIAKLARDLHIDIAIDLAGLTGYSRTGIFSYRAAPIQVNWLGYPGTIGANFIDYVIADKTVIPESYKEAFTEKIVYLPHTYIVDDSKRVPSARVFTKEECGLPENAFVFCCFNNDFKFNPTVLDRWSRILCKVECSVLWISENNDTFKKNIKSEFKKRGIDPIRVIFAQRLDLMADHLARYALADLFLDTHPYNAHTTAVDSLKAGIPVLTLKGQSFPSRVAASLLQVIGLPELIADTGEEYETLAVELATSPLKLLTLKQKLSTNRLTCSLFDTSLFARNLEASYIQIYERYMNNLQPDHIY